MDAAAAENVRTFRKPSFPASHPTRTDATAEAIPAAMNTKPIAVAERAPRSMPSTIPGTAG